MQTVPSRGGLARVELLGPGLKGPVKILLLQSNIQKAVCWTFTR